MARLLFTFILLCLPVGSLAADSLLKTMCEARDGYEWVEDECVEETSHSTLPSGEIVLETSKDLEKVIDLGKRDFDKLVFKIKMPSSPRALFAAIYAGFKKDEVIYIAQKKYHPDSCCSLPEPSYSIVKKDEKSCPFEYTFAGKEYYECVLWQNWTEEMLDEMAGAVFYVRFVPSGFVEDAVPFGVNFKYSEGD